MKETTRENIIALNSKINESRSNEKYCDVTIKVGEKSFKCHRLILGSASEYFDAMFRGNFRESKSKDIELKEIEATTFEEVIQFIYTGDVLVTKLNVLNLLRTSEFYNLPNLKQPCCQFVREQIEQGALIEDALEIFAFSYGTTQELVVSLSAYIREHLHYFSNTSSFLNLQLNELKKILAQSALSKNENEVVHAILQWTHQSNHSKDVKDEILNDLLEKIDYKNISPEYVKYIVKQSVREHTASKENENDKSTEGNAKNEDVLTVESSTVSGVGKTCVVNSSMPQSLYVYINSPERVINVFILQEYTCGFEWMFLCKANDNSDVMKIASLDNHLYCLNYCKPQASSSSVQTLSVSSSVSLFDKLYLKAPPLIVNQFDMDRVNNCLYMYNKDIFSNVVRSYEDLEFSDEAISRGVYAYNCEIDKWMSLPPLLQKLANACMTYNQHSGLLYLIGGRNPTQEKHHGYVQAYDPRCASWMVITPSLDFYENGVCCSSDNYDESYVSGGLEFPAYLEAYDTVGGKWRRLVVEQNLVENCYRLISHGDNEWAFGENVSESSVAVFHNDDSTSGWCWSEVPSLSVAVEKNESVQKLSSISNVLDCVSFKPHGL